MKEEEKDLVRSVEYDDNGTSEAAGGVFLNILLEVISELEAPWDVYLSKNTINRLTTNAILPSKGSWRFFEQNNYPDNVLFVQGGHEKSMLIQLVPPKFEFDIQFERVPAIIKGDRK